jgi:hypothetical protein
VAGRAVVQDLHHAGGIRKPHTRRSTLKILDLHGSCPVLRRPDLSDGRRGRVGPFRALA